MKIPEACRVSAMLALALAAGCATTETEWAERPGPGLIDEVAAVLVGDYSNHAQWQREGAAGGGPIELRVWREPIDDPASAALRLSQSRPGQAPRVFQVTLAPDQRPDVLAGQFAPVADDGRVRRVCPMSFTVRRTGFVGETDPESCQFGDTGRRTGLIKEIAHDGRQLVIGDRLVSVATGEPVGEDRILRFDRVRPFSGWAGVREDGGDWRLAESIHLLSDGAGARPKDAAGMDLGIRLELAPYFWRDDGPALLRLTVIDLENGDTLGQAWADISAEQIGLALPDLQVGLHLGQ